MSVGRSGMLAVSTDDEIMTCAVTRARFFCDFRVCSIIRDNKFDGKFFGHLHGDPDGRDTSWWDDAQVTQRPGALLGVAERRRAARVDRCCCRRRLGLSSACSRCGGARAHSWTLTLWTGCARVAHSLLESLACGGSACRTISGTTRSWRRMSGPSASCALQVRACGVIHHTYVCVFARSFHACVQWRRTTRPIFRGC